MNIEVLSVNDLLDKITKTAVAPERKKYHAMYSSWWQGIITDPRFMFVPVDDHQVHRGDAVFEALKAVNKKIYLMNDHLDRLDRSALALGLKNPFTRADMVEILQSTLKASKLDNAILRLFLSRGPGSFSPSPYDTLGAQVYLVITETSLISNEKLNSGFKISISKISPKEPWLAQIKSCNYLQNVLMKKEALDLGVDFTIGINEKGFITEGSTENLILLNQKNELLKPKKENILLGTTMERAFKLSKNILDIHSAREADISLDDLKSAKEIMMVGTTLDVISVTTFEGRPVGEGRPGKVALALRDLILRDQKL